MYEVLRVYKLLHISKILFSAFVVVVVVCINLARSGSVNGSLGIYWRSGLHEFIYRIYVYTYSHAIATIYYKIYTVVIMLCIRM